MDKKVLGWVIYLSILLLPPLLLSLYCYLKTSRTCDDWMGVFGGTFIWFALILGYGSIPFGMYLEDLTKLMK